MLSNLIKEIKEIAQLQKEKKIIIKPARLTGGHSARIYLPKSWDGKEVMCIRMD